MAKLKHSSRNLIIGLSILVILTMSIIPQIKKFFADKKD